MFPTPVWIFVLHHQTTPAPPPIPLLPIYAAPAPFRRSYTAYFLCCCGTIPFVLTIREKNCITKNNTLPSYTTTLSTTSPVTGLARSLTYPQVHKATHNFVSPRFPQETALQRLNGRPSTDVGLDGISQEQMCHCSMEHGSEQRQLAKLTSFSTAWVTECQQYFEVNTGLEEQLQYLPRIFFLKRSTKDFNPWMLHEKIIYSEIY